MACGQRHAGEHRIWDQARGIRSPPRRNVSRAHRLALHTGRSRWYRRRRLRPRQPAAGTRKFQVGKRRAAPGAPAAAATSTQFTPLQVAELYSFPSNFNGTGECIGIIELGGGYKTTDLQTYFSQLGLSAPSVTSVSVNGGSNSPTGSVDGPDGEVMLDIEISGSIAPRPRSSSISLPTPIKGSSTRSPWPCMTRRTSRR